MTPSSKVSPAALTVGFLLADSAMTKVAESHLTQKAPEEKANPLRGLSFWEQAPLWALVKIVRLSRKIKTAISEEPVKTTAIA